MKNITKNIKLILQIFLTIIAIYVIFNSINSYTNKINYFEITKVIISGNNFLQKDVINKIIYNEINNETINSIDLTKVKKSINNHSFINSSNIYIKIPNSLVVDVKEIKPIALYEKNNQIFFIDYYYNLIDANVESINFFNVPIINQNDVINYKYTDTGKLIKKIITNSNFLFNYINEIEYISDNIYLNMDNKTKIILTREKSISELDILFEFISKINNNISEYKYIDLTTQNQIIVKEKQKTI